jgi:hypothetical protein
MREMEAREQLQIERGMSVEKDRESSYRDKERDRGRANGQIWGQLIWR